MSTRVVAFRPASSSSQGKKGDLPSQVLPFVPRPKRPAVPAHEMAKRIALLVELAKDWGVQITVLDTVKGVDA